MHEALRSPERARRRTLKCASAWTLASAALAVAVFGAVRYEPILAAYFDWPILLKLNHYVFQQPTLNRATNTITDLPILTGALLIAPLWYFWFESKSESAKAGLLLGLGAAVAAVILSRGLQLMLPTHLRPLLDPVPGFNIPPGMNPAELNDWSSFPSDHACIYFALTTVIWRRSRLLGILALLPTLLSSLPKMYLGYHYPSDVAFGALLGIAVVLLVENYGPEAFARKAVLFEHKRPGVFYSCGFLLTYEIGTLFSDIRTIGSGLVKLYRLLGH